MDQVFWMHNMMLDDRFLDDTLFDKHFIYFTIRSYTSGRSAAELLLCCCLGRVWFIGTLVHDESILCYSADHLAWSGVDSRVCRLEMNFLVHPCMSSNLQIDSARLRNEGQLIVKARHYMRIV